MNEFFIGIDVQTKRDCCYAISDNNGDLKGSGWFGNDNKNFINLLKKSPTTPIGRGLMKTPRRGLKASQLLQITIQYSGRSYQAKRL